MSRRVNLAPGTYTVRNITAGTDATVNVPTLTVAIAQVAPAVGAVLSLTTNAAAGAAYQWRAGGVDINLATSATFNTTGRSAGDVITCRVVSGAQTVTSAGVTLAAGGVAATYLGSSALAFGFNDRTHTAPASLAAGQKYVIGIAHLDAGSATFTGVTVNGTAAVQRGSTSTADDGATTRFFEVTPASSGTTLVTQGVGPSASAVHYYSVSNSATFQGGVASTATIGNSRDVSVNVDPGDLVLAITAHSFQGSALATGSTWTGLDEDGFISPGTHVSSGAASAEGVVGATPRTITVDRVGTTNNNDGYAASSVVFG